MKRLLSICAVLSVSVISVLGLGMTASQASTGGPVTCWLTKHPGSVSAPILDRNHNVEGAAGTICRYNGTIHYANVDEISMYICIVDLTRYRTGCDFHTVHGDFELYANTGTLQCVRGHRYRVQVTEFVQKNGAFDWFTGYGRTGSFKYC